jgi:hypothetical protein
MLLGLQLHGIPAVRAMSGRQAAQSLWPVGSPQQMEPVRYQEIETPGAKGRGNRGMPSAEDYRRNASECVRLAQNAQNPADKALLLKMAETWLRLAEQAEGRESKDPD